MGVPRFFSWITKRYPMILNLIDHTSLPDIDCLYLDMNGIIYKCSKDESIIFKAQVMSKQIQQIWLSIFNYINQIVNLIKPKKLLFLGLDGVAPRAKMNNQRSRRFKSAKDYKQLERKLEFYGQSTNQQAFKNNCITPGTQFMNELNKQIRFFIKKKIAEDPQWKKFNVIFSGADVPGEGEHKIMNYIRKSRQLNIYNEKISHCLYGADADLIMLALGLKIQNLIIIRQKFTPQSKKLCISNSRNAIEIKFQIIFINILKEYIDLEYNELKSKMKVQYNLQNIINDFVFLCFFIGNDFLPRCYCYDIRQGNLEELIYAFKNFLVQCDDYLIHQNQINMVEFERLLKFLSSFEARFITSRSNQIRKLYQKQGNGPKIEDDDTKQFQNEFFENLKLKQEMLKSEQQFLLNMKTLYLNDQLQAKKIFYQTKLKIDPAAEPQNLKLLFQNYLQGLNYVYQYYFKELPSWEWYYPYYYAPLVSDLYKFVVYINENKIKLPEFKLSEPFQPFKQLLCILPKQSYQLLPSCLHPLIKDAQSKLRNPKDYFPDKIETDAYGGLHEHQYINILPFIDQNVIQEAYNSIEKNFTKEELERNIKTQNQLYQYKKDANLKVKSFYPSIKDFTVDIEIHPINFSNQDIRKVQGLNIKQCKKGLSFPSLKKNSFRTNFRRVTDRNKAYILELQILKSQNTEEDLKLGEEVYYGYPFEDFGRIVAISTFSTFFAVVNFDICDFFNQQPREYRNPRQIWQKAIDDINYNYAGLRISTEKIYFIQKPFKNIRKRNGTFYESYYNRNDKLLPSQLVSSSPKYNFTKQKFNPKKLEQQFIFDEDVIILFGQYAGSSGKVVKHNNKTLIVELKQKITTIPKQLLSQINTNQYFFNVNFIALTLQCHIQVLFMILDSLPVQLKKDVSSFRGMPNNLDIGLNFIRRHQRRLVPSLVRIPYSQAHKFKNSFQEYYRLELNVTAVLNLFEYKKTYPFVFDFLEDRFYRLSEQAKKLNQKLNWREVINAEDIFKQYEDPNLPLIKLYLWIIKKQEAHHPNSATNAKKVSQKKISMLLNYFQKEMIIQPTQKKLLQYDPNYIYSKRLAEEGLMYLKESPGVHMVGDRVICLNLNFFGERGVVIGIDHNQYEILFQKPSFGKDNLGGLVDYLWGGKFFYEELYNIQVWQKLLEKRDQKNDRKGWDGTTPIFNSKFSNKGIENVQQYLTISKYLNFSNQMTERILNIQKQKQGEQFTQVVNKRKKYKSYQIKKEQIQILNQVNQENQSNEQIQVKIKSFAQKKQSQIEQATQIYRNKTQTIEKQIIEVKDEKNNYKPTKVLTKKKKQTTEQIKQINQKQVVVYQQKKYQIKQQETIKQVQKQKVEKKPAEKQQVEKPPVEKQTVEIKQPIILKQQVKVEAPKKKQNYISKQQMNNKKKAQKQSQKVKQKKKYVEKNEVEIVTNSKPDQIQTINLPQIIKSEVVIIENNVKEIEDQAKITIQQIELKIQTKQQEPIKDNLQNKQVQNQIINNNVQIDVKLIVNQQTTQKSIQSRQQNLNEQSANNQINIQINKTQVVSQIRQNQSQQNIQKVQIIAQSVQININSNIPEKQENKPLQINQQPISNIEIKIEQIVQIKKQQTLNKQPNQIIVENTTQIIIQADQEKPEQVSQIIVINMEQQQQIPKEQEDTEIFG